MLHLAPGQRIAFHGHMLAVASRRGRMLMHPKALLLGETRHETYNSSESIGDTELVCTVVEFLDGVNEPLYCPDRVRRGYRASVPTCFRSTQTSWSWLSRHRTRARKPGMSVFRLDLVDDPYLAGCTVRIFVLAEVFLS